MKGGGVQITEQSKNFRSLGAQTGAMWGGGGSVSAMTPRSSSLGLKQFYIRRQHSLKAKMHLTFPRGWCLIMAPTSLDGIMAPVIFSSNSHGAHQ